jgi:hypothetical protein
MNRPLVLAVAATLLVPGGAAASVCHYTPPKSRVRQQIDEDIAARAQWGLPRGRAFVARLERDPRARRRGLAILDFPMTKREAAYFHDRSRVEGETHAVGDYAEAISGLSGGVSTEDDYPTGAYVQLRVTRPLTEREVADLAGAARRLRVRQVRYPEEALRRLQDSIDFPRATRNGITIWSSSADIDRNAVALTYSARRLHAARVLHELYDGPLALTRVRASTPTCEDPTGYTVGSDGRTLRVGWGTSGSSSHPRVWVRERPGRVIVGGVVDEPPIVLDNLVGIDAKVRLSRPLGNRPVVSALTHRSVPRRNRLVLP